VRSGRFRSAGKVPPPIGRSAGQLFDFTGHDGKPFAGFTRAGGFDGRVQGQQVGLQAMDLITS